MEPPTRRAVRSRLGTVTAALTAERGVVFASVTLGFVLLNAFRYIIPALLPFLREAFEMGLSTAGLLLTLIWLAYAIGQAPGGILGDRFGERNILAGSCLLGALTVVVIALSPGRIGFFLGAIGFGLSVGLYAPTRFTVLSDLFPERSGTIIGLNLGFNSIGLTAFPIGAAVIAGVLGWRVGFGFMAPLIAVAVLGIWLTVPRRTSEPMAEGGSVVDTFIGPVRTLLEPAVLVSVGAMVCMHFLFQSFTSFYPTYLIEIKGVDEQTAAFVYGLFFALGTVFQPTSGVVGDRIGFRRTMLLIVIVTMTGLLLLPFGTSLVHLVGITAILSLQRGFWPIANTYLIDLFPEDIQGTGLGLSRTGYIMIAATGPVIVGTIADMGYFVEAFLGLAAVAGFGGFLVLLLLRME